MPGKRSDHALHAYPPGPPGSPWLLVLFIAIFSCPPVAAQHYLEARLADPEYFYLDWNATFSNAAIVDVFYVGVPGSNEFNLGGGYVFKASTWFTVTPLAYAVLAEEGAQRGVKFAVLASFEKNGWKGSGFLARFVRVSGDVPNYDVLDTLDGTRKFGQNLEIGLSSGFFHAEGEWNFLLGPLVKWNDRWGSWFVSYRFGDSNELRGGRVFIPGPSKRAG